MGGRGSSRCLAVDPNIAFFIKQRGLVDGVGFDVANTHTHTHTHTHSLTHSHTHTHTHTLTLSHTHTHTH